MTTPTDEKVVEALAQVEALSEALVECKASLKAMTRERDEARAYLDKLFAEVGWPGLVTILQEENAALCAQVKATERAWSDFRFRLVNTYGGPSPYLRVEEMDTIFTNFYKTEEPAKEGA